VILILYLDRFIKKLPNLLAGYPRKTVDLDTFDGQKSPAQIRQDKETDDIRHPIIKIIPGEHGPKTARGEYSQETPKSLPD
jgi:hypothetical protein